MLIRIALPSDACAISKLYAQLVKDDAIQVTASGIAALAMHRATLLVCEVDQIVAGTVLVQLCADVMYAQQPYDKALIHIALLPNARRLRRQIVSEVAEAGEGSHVLSGDGTYLVCHDELEQQRKHNGDEVPELHQIGRKYRTKTRIIIRYTFTLKHSDLPNPQSAVVHDYTPAFIGA